MRFVERGRVFGVVTGKLVYSANCLLECRFRRLEGLLNSIRFIFCDLCENVYERSVVVRI